jgi:hypothetical protein
MNSNVNADDTKTNEEVKNENIENPNISTNDQASIKATNILTFDFDLWVCESAISGHEKEPENVKEEVGVEENKNSANIQNEISTKNSTTLERNCFLELSNPFVQEYIVNFQNSEGIAIVFDPLTKLKPSQNKIQIYDTNSDVPLAEYPKVLPPVTDNNTDNISPIIIPCSNIKIVHSLKLVSDWGFKLVAYPTKLPLDPWRVYKRPGRFQVLESSHPYPDNADETFPVKIKGQTKLLYFLTLKL